MTNIIIGIIIGMVVWQLVVTINGLITDFDSEIANNIMCGVWAILFYIIVKPIVFLLWKIIYHRFYSKYLRCEFIENNEVVDQLYIDKDITNTFIIFPNKKRYVSITKTYSNCLPYRENIITKEMVVKDPEKYKFLNKWKRID